MLWRDNAWKERLLKGPFCHTLNTYLDSQLGEFLSQMSVCSCCFHYSHSLGRLYKNRNLAALAEGPWLLSSPHCTTDFVKTRASRGHWRAVIYKLKYIHL